MPKLNFLKKHRALKLTALSLIVIVLSVGGFLGWKVSRNTSKIFGGNILGIFTTSKLKGEDVGRVNILLIGNSSDDPGHGGANLTDSIMLISLDTANNGGFMMSIPRDLWVSYDTTNCSLGNQGKINATFVCGEETKFSEDGYPQGGEGLLEKVIEDNFGVKINYFANLDYTAFKQAVNAVGGIDVTIKSDDPRGLYDGNIGKADGGPLKLANGLQHLDGQTALNLARARGETISYGFSRSDYTRTDNQRLMLVALKDKALSAGVLSNPAKLSSLLDAAGDNVKTDFHTNEIRRLYDLVKQVSNDKVQSIGLANEGVSLVQGFTSPNGLSAVRPVAGVNDFSQIKLYTKRLTSNDPVVKENAIAVVLNASEISGLAQKKADILKDKGINVKAIANAAKTRATTVVVSLGNNQKTATKAYLEAQYKTTATTDVTANPEAANYQADFVIILGQNEAPAN